MRSASTGWIAAHLLVSDFDILHAAASTGLGIAPLPAYRCVDDQRVHRLERVLRDWNAPATPVHAVCPTAQRPHMLRDELTGATCFCGYAFRRRSR